MTTDQRNLSVARMLSPGTRVCMVLALIAVVAGLGLGAAGDSVLRRGFYALRGERGTHQRVLLVAIDAPSVAAWGAPPYRDGQLDAVFSAITAGSPRSLGVADDAARLVRGPLPDRVAGLRGTLALGNESVEAMSLDGKRVAINYLGTRGLPTVSAIDVAHGKLPSEAFAGKIVVVGITAQPFAGLVPTPVGPLTPAQVHAHGLSTIADHAGWAQTPGWVHWLVIALACVVAVLLAHHLGMIGAMIGTAAAVALLCLLDYVLFATGSVRFGATLPVIALLVASAYERVYERVVLHRHVREIAHWTRRWMLLESMRTEVPDDRPGYWRRVGQLARLYLGSTSSIIAELPAGHERLKMRVLGGTGTQQIRERRLDIRRSPYRKAHLTLGPVWHDEFMTDGTKTLIVPLVVRSSALIGFWMVSFERKETVTPSHMALIKTLAREIAVAIDRGRTEQPVAEHGVAGWLFGARRFALELDEVRRAFHAHAQNQQDLLTLGESMPFGVFVASLWGDLRYANTAMKAVCRNEGIDVTSANADLADLVSKLTGRRSREIHRHMRELVQAHDEVHLHGRDRGDKASHDLVLSWLKGSSDDAEQLVVGCLLPRSASVRSAPPPKNGSSDDHAVTSMVPKFDAKADDHALTMRLPKLEAALGIDDEADREPLANGTPPPFAQGTPTFPNDPPRLEASELIALGSPLAPQATLRMNKIADVEDEIVTGVAHGSVAGPDDSPPPSNQALGIDFD